MRCNPLRELLHRRLLLLELRKHWCCNHDRRVGADQHADEQHERQILQGTCTKQTGTDTENGRNWQDCNNRRIDRTHEHLIDRDVRDCRVGATRLAADTAGVLLDLVEYDHGVIERIAQNRQQADHRCRRDLETSECIHTNGHHHVVKECYHRCKRHLGLEVDTEEDDDEHEEHEQALDCLLGDVTAP